jgi:hypothetical protein
MKDLGKNIWKIKMGVSPIDHWNSKVNMEIANEIKRCPLCTQQSHCNLEHLHIYCEEVDIKDTREWANEKIEEQLRNMYQKHSDLQNLMKTDINQQISTTYSLTQECGLFPIIPEEEFDIKTATANDFGYMGIINTTILHALNIQKVEAADKNLLIALITLRTYIMQKLISWKIQEKVKCLSQTERKQ